MRICILVSNWSIASHIKQHFIQQNMMLSMMSNDFSQGAQWLSGRVLDSRMRGHGFEPHRCHCVVSLSKNIYPSLVRVQPRKTCPFITERLLMGCKESNQTNKQFQSLQDILSHIFYVIQSDVTLQKQVL